jgi:colanic acid/amylovoran biosynthesis glycosyltransferase
MIAFTHYSDDINIGGVTTWLLGLVRSLKASGNEVACLLHYCGTSGRESWVASALRDLGAHVEEKRRPEFMNDCVASVLGFLQRTQPQIFIPQCLMEGFYAARIAGKKGLPWVFTFHSDEPLYWGPLESCRPTECRGLIVPVSASIAAIIKGRFGWASASVIPCGTNIPSEQAQWRCERFEVVYSGRLMETQKRISLILEAMQLACAKCDRIHCKIIGGGAQEELLRRTIDSRGLGGRIKVTGALPPEAVGVEMQVAHAILLMSDYEGLPVALLEAMARGVVPVVRNIRSGIPELVRDHETGLLVNENPESAAQAIARLANSEALWRSFSHNARALITERYGADDCFAKWNELIASSRLTPEAARVLRLPKQGRLPRRNHVSAAWDHRRPSLAHRGLAQTTITLGRWRRRFFLSE